jgi:hypothetical protein
MAGKKGKSGRKSDAPVNYDENFKKEIKSVLNKLKKKHGKSFLEAVFELMFDSKTQDSVKASLFKTYSEIFAVKKSETKTESNVETHRGPVIGLPPIRGEDPAMKIVGREDG